MNLKRVYLSLGSNLGDRHGYIERAVDQIREAGIQVLRVSGIYETEPVEITGQPWFLNCVVEAETDAMPRQLLRRLQRIETNLGRRRGVARGPRTLDIDILLFGKHVIDTAELVVPHPRMHERRFVLEPLRELAPDLRHPVIRKTVAEMLAQAPPQKSLKFQV